MDVSDDDKAGKSRTCGVPPDDIERIVMPSMETQYCGGTSLQKLGSIEGLTENALGSAPIAKTL